MNESSIPNLDAKIRSQLAKDGHKLTAAIYFSSLVDDYSGSRIINIANLYRPQLWIALLDMPEIHVSTPSIMVHVTMDGTIQYCDR